MKTILITILLLSSRITFAQDQYFFQFMNNAMNLEKPMSYVGVGKFTRLENARKLSDAEGGKDYKIEMNLFAKFPLLQKRLKNGCTGEKIIPLLGYTRVWIDYGFHTRVPKGVSSAPILPPTNRYGLRLDKLIFVKWTKRNETSDPMMIEPFRSKNETAAELPNEGTFWFGFASLYVHHYSNSQPEGVYKDNDPKLGNDYIKGDFSTNHWRVSASLHHANLNKNHLAMTVGFQHEFGSSDTTKMFRFIPEQRKRYGINRLLVSAQYQFMIPFLRKFECLYKVINQMKVRGDLEYITDNDLSKYRYSNKYPLGIHLYAEIPIYALPSLGIIVHYYRGRDYLNNRYDDPVSVWQFGLSLEFSRFTLQTRDEQMGITRK